jgi:hypothetical protein
MNCRKGKVHFNISSFKNVWCFILLVKIPKADGQILTKVVISSENED